MNKLMNRAKKDNKGFSLVELIIVIAIMAILIGVVALQVVPYLEKSRTSKDKQLVDSVYSAFQTGIASVDGISDDISLKITSAGIADNGSVDTTNAAKVIAEMIPVLGASTVTDIAAGTADKLSSADAKDAAKGNATITCKFDFSSKQIVVEVPNTDIKSQNK